MTKVRVEYLTPWPLQYGATRVEVQPDGSLAYPGALTDGEYGRWFLSYCSVNLDLNGYLFRLPALYNQLASGDFIDARGHPALYISLFCSQNEVAASPPPPDSFHTYYPGLCITAICTFLDYMVWFVCVSGNGRRGPLPQHLSVQEELLLRRFYEKKIQQVCAAFMFPNKIQVWALQCKTFRSLIIVVVVYQMSLRWIPCKHF